VRTYQAIDSRGDVLDAYLKKMCEWPQQWCYEDSDLEYGLAAIEVFIPFMRWLVDQGYARTTLRRHCDNLCVLGNEVIQRRRQDCSLRNFSARNELLNLLDVDGGPLLYRPSLDDVDQRSFDATCRKLNAFMTRTIAPCRREVNMITKDETDVAVAEK